ncbi:MAG: mechanosensitive ion channel family protein [Opitutales bacterium]
MTFDFLHFPLPGFIEDALRFLAADRTQQIVSVVLTLLVGFILLRILMRVVRGIIRKHSDEHTSIVISRILFYILGAILLLVVLQSIGLELTALLGAAGVLSLAFGLAAQTGLSNLISGFFLLWERPFRVGDLIEVDGVVGSVLSVDLTSTKLRKLDNIYVRIPNENLVKATVMNITRHPIRRMDFTIGVAYKEDPARVIDVLKKVAAANPLVLDSPEALVLFQGFGDSAQEFLFGVWFEKTTFVAVRNKVLCDVKASFDKEGIEIPFPYRSLVAGSGDPIRVELATKATGLVLPSTDKQ